MIVLGIILASLVLYAGTGLALRVKLTPSIAPRYTFQAGDLYWRHGVQTERDSAGIRTVDFEFELALLQWLWPVMLWVAAARNVTHQQLRTLDPGRVARDYAALQRQIADSEAENERLRRVNDALTQR